MSSFNGKNIAVIGGTSGIGLEAVKLLVSQHANVYNVSRRACEIDGVKNISLDITEDFQKIEGLPDQLDGLIYSPGSINLKPFQSLKLEDYRTDFEINVLGALKTIKAVLKNLKSSSSKPGIVLFSTVAVTQGMSFHTSVAAAKGAIEGVTRSLAAEFAKNNIRVNTIAPSLTDTPLASGLLASDEKRKASEDRHPLKKIGEAADVAAMAVHLLSENSKWITGQIIHMDGGMSSVRPL
ncbi:MAG: NAD(P)-dependent dehydrogenase (short-subunit alcohol dehydrogenase family) [Cyclobacteriaceae bacterium]|jgi:NAD(P)-dependent dehydrogenase (short-subunit alcohol dehydrogenase family)